MKTVVMTAGGEQDGEDEARERQRQRICATRRRIGRRQGGGGLTTLTAVLSTHLHDCAIAARSSSPKTVARPLCLWTSWLSCNATWPCTILSTCRHPLRCAMERLSRERQSSRATPRPRLAPP